MEILSTIQNSQGFNDILKRAKELRNLVFQMILTWFCGLMVAYYFQTPIYNLYVDPLKASKLTLNFLSPTDSIMFYIKIFSVSGLLISLPVQVFLFWKYIKDALLQNEQLIILRYFWVGSIVSLVALIYGWVIVLPSVFQFLIGINPPQTQLLLTANEYSNFVVGLLLMLIITFQLPLIVFSLIKLKIVTKEQFANKRREIFVGILIITALFGSPDVFTWLLTVIPVMALFEISLILSQIHLSKE
jgi:sec-independent protein translocase protein TatC